MHSSTPVQSLLLVEDNSADFLLIKEVLKDIDLDLQLDVLSDGKKVLPYLDTHACPNLMLMDMHMPGMTGLEVLHALAGRHEGRIIMWSTGCSAAEVQRVLDAGADGFVQKPGT
ncbi:response regulator [Deinococcus hopiensis]|uniref:Response regulator containing a CheY-like receiver domain and an HTH DNA-binding domain n=1 Tax=Deinococcus hopiensis KR-140 TaxID=695939 RepID=A0A1W1UXF8_9DEIO|nr:response regulator [Deinococcus hopiensis]SMB85434.1 Response regulator containing a CheY-like receiver domain and an HTH DNA-binding domain [Deinococcus hopiensis KR-140]